MPIRVLLVFFCVINIALASAQESSSVNIKKIVIDAGHGGRDPGTSSPDGKHKEKDITLSVALKLGTLIKTQFPNIEVIYTREKDVAVALDKRTEIANKNKADLFISIHVNGVKSRSPSGSETFVMGADKSNSNFQVSMLENSVILLEGDDYETRYEGFNPNDPESYIIFTLLQNAHLEQSLAMATYVQKYFNNGPIKINRGIKQAPFVVLWKTSMPSVLIELGFISNTGDLKILADKRNQDKLASLIFDAFKEYRNQYDKGYNNVDYITPVGQSIAHANETETKPIEIKEIKAQEISQKEKKAEEITLKGVKSQQTKVKENIHYRVQILSVSKILPSNASDFKGEQNVQYLKKGSLVKYTIGEFKNREEATSALQQIRKKFPQAFLIKVNNNTIIN